ncbi:MAG: RNA polymerase sigma factor [Clostridia bacterium]
MTEAEFCDAIQTHQHLLYHIAYLLLGNGSECEDAVQESICRAWHKRGTLKNPEAMKAWLCTIATNECRSLLRKRCKRTEVPLDESTLLLNDNSEESRALHEAIRALPGEYSLLVILYYIEGFSQKEIAKVIKRPVGTVQNRLFRARQQLREQLTEEEIK